MPQTTPRKARGTQSFPLHRCSTPLALDCKRFIDWALLHGYSEATLRSWSRFLVLFCLWAQERDLHRSHDITLSLLERYQRHLFAHRKANGESLTLA